MGALFNPHLLVSSLLDRVKLKQMLMHKQICLFSLSSSVTSSSHCPCLLPSSSNALHVDTTAVPVVRNNRFIYLLRQTLRELVKRRIRGAAARHGTAADKSV